MAKRKVSKPIEDVKYPSVVDAAPVTAGKCAACRAWKRRNALGGKWVGDCKTHKRETGEGYSCDKFEAVKNG